MGLTVNTNTQSLFAQRALRENTRDLQKSIEKLSTGSRITRGGDDAAGLSISNKMTTLIRGMDQAKRNIGDGVGLISTLDGALGTVQDNLQRIRELTVQGINGTNGPDERDAIQREINERVTAINTMGTQAQFNGVNLLKGTQNITLQIGANDGQSLTMVTTAAQTASVGFLVNFSSTTLGSLGEKASVSLSAFTIGSANVATRSGITAATATTNALLNLDSMINNVSRMRSQIGAYENSLGSNMDYLDRYSESLRGARSRVEDVDVAEESGVFVRNQILQQTSSAMLSQANSSQQIALSLLP